MRDTDFGTGYETKRGRRPLGSRMADTAKLAHGSIAGHLARQSVPMMFGIAAIMSIGIIDAYFVGRLGAAQLAAISFIFPVTTALSSLGVGIIAGVSSVVSRALGGDDEEKAQRLGNLGMALSIGVGVVIAGLLLMFHRPLFAQMQAEGETLDLIGVYMLPFSLGFPALLAVMGFNGVLRGQGAAKRSTAILLTFAVANWILDPILIDGWLGFEGMGIAGAAWATVAGWVLGCVVGLVLTQRSVIPFRPRAVLSADWKQGTRDIARVAVPAAASNAINPLGLSILTSLLAAQGAAAVAGFGVGGRLQTMAVVPLLALSSSIGAIVGQNWGADKTSRARMALVYACGFCLLYGFAAAFVLFSQREWFASRFTEDAEVVAAASRYLAIAAWGYAGYGVLIVINGAFNAIDHARLALALSVARVFVVMVPVAWLLRGSLGADAIYYSELACNVAGCLAGIAAAVWLFGSTKLSGNFRPRLRHRFDHLFH